MASLKRSLGAVQAAAMSIAIISPTLAMAFSVSLATQAAGRSAPLAFLLGGGAAALIGLSFVAFARRIASAGSVAAYVGFVWGPRWGFLAGWALLLTYLGFMTSTSALVGSFVTVLLAHVGVEVPGLWLAVALAAGVLVFVLGGREIRGLTRLMLGIEICAVLALIALAAIVLGTLPWSAAPFLPDPTHGLSGLGYGMAFAILSFAGFEGAATVAEETHDPHRAIPQAIFGSVLAAGLLYVVVSYALVLGFGPDNAAELGRSKVPLDVLAGRFVSSSYGSMLDLAAAVSSLGLTLAAGAAAARLLFSMDRNGLFGHLALARLDVKHGAPRRALWVVGSLNCLGLLMLGSWAGAHAYAESTATVGTLAVLLVYVGVALAQAAMARRDRRWPWMAAGVIGAAALLWPLIASLYPARPWPANLWPIVVLAWLAIGAGLARSRRLAPFESATVKTSCTSASSE